MHKRVGFCLLALLLLSVTARAAILERYEYLEKDGADSKFIDWKLEKGNFLKLTATRCDETNVLLNNAAFETMRWDYRNPTEGTKVIAKRDGATIALQGTYKGKPIKKDIPIDDAPWYQGTALSLRQLVLSDKDSVEFWMLRPDNLNPQKLKAEKKGIERIPVNGETVDVQKVQLKPVGIMAIFFDYSYWFRKGDGVLMRVEGPKGADGCAMEWRLHRVVEPKD